LALPRRLVQQLKRGTYQKSNIGRKAREAATRLHERGGGKYAPPPLHPPFESTKRRMITKKHIVYREVFGYNPSGSAEAVNESEARDKMEVILERATNTQMDYYASMAAQAWAQLNKTGDAGDLEIYLDYDFLFYH